MSYVNTDDDHPHPYLKKPKIRTHMQSIAKNMIKLIDDEIIFETLLVDEIKKLYLVLNSFKTQQIYVKKLKEILDKYNYDIEE